MLAWPVRTRLTPITLDLSWQLGLHQAADDGLRFGHDIVFTYGPLGFLGSPTPFVGVTSAMAWFASAAMYLGLIGLLLHASVRLFPAWVAVLLTLVFAKAITWLEPFDALQVLPFGLGVEVLRRSSIERPWVVAIAAGVIAGFAILGKSNVGVFVSAMGIIVVVATSRPRVIGFVTFAIAIAATSLGLWLASGQDLSDVVPFGRATAEIIAGYSDAMSVNRSTLLQYGAYALLAMIVAACAFRTSLGWSPGRRLGLGALTVVFLFAVWKFGFVRSHFAPAFVMLAFAALFVVPSSVPTPWKALTVATVAATFFVVVPAAVTAYPDFGTSFVEFFRQGREAVMAWDWDAATERSRHTLRSAFDVPPEIQAVLGGHTVSVDPYAAGIATVYPGLDWHPVPIFQAYSAYTPALDQMNADALRSETRPAYILRQFQPTSKDPTVPAALDGRNYWFESPAATIERLCRYREVVSSGSYQVLADTGRACATAVPVKTVTARFGEAVEVPAAPTANDLVLVRVNGVNAGPLARARSALWSTPPWRVVLDGHSYRLVPGTAGDGLVLAVPTTAQGSPPFAFGPAVRSIAIRGSDPGGSHMLTYEFMTMRVADGGQ